MEKEWKKRICSKYCPRVPNGSICSTLRSLSEAHLPCSLLEDTGESKGEKNAYK